ncbi:MAG: hypothetical protein IT454_11225 [Planctomycetes bacterium]|nr:hypothetical protein [Planctomycetota bacterium]
MSRPSLWPVLAALASAAWAPCAQAQTFISGALSDSTTGPLGSGVYVTTGNISVPAGQTLTIAAGAIVKFQNGYLFSVDGTLKVNGNAGNKVIFTDIRDDSAGGDTNANGASSGGAGWWYGLLMNDGSDASTLAHFEVRYAGYGYYGGLHMSQSSASFSNGLVRNGLSGGAYLGNNSFPTISACSFQSNGGIAIDGVDVDALPGFANNTATSNGLNGVRVTSGGVSTNATLSPANGINGAVYFDSTLGIPAGKTLTIQAGTVLKFQNGQYVNVDGTLLVNGSSGNKVIFTDFRDDSAGGDTNSDGASSGSAGWWYGLLMNDGSDASVLSSFEVRYAGYGYYGGLHLNLCDATFSGGIVRNGYSSGAYLGNNSFPSISACSFQSNAGRAIDGVPLAALPDLLNNTATSNGSNQVRVVSATVAAPLTLGPANGINGAVFLDATLVVPAAQTLTLQAGLVLKIQTGQWVNVDGTLIAQGASNNPVVFTDYRDDSVGGDTNGDGASGGSAGWWWGLYFNGTSDSSALDYFEVRYAGYGYGAGVNITDSDLKLTRGVVRNCFSAGIDLSGSSARPLINRCLIQQNGASAIARASMAAVPFITRNTATGNAYNHLLVTNGTVSGNLYIDGNAGVNDVVVMQTTLNVPTGAHLTLGPGASFKIVSGQYVNVDGTLDVIGSESDPVVFTDYRDDSIGGDSNGDGSSTGAPGWWYGLLISSNATSNGIDHLRVRYGGYGYYAAITNASPAVGFDHVRVEHSFAYGFQLDNAARARFLATVGCASGILLNGGNFTLEHATVPGGDRGIRDNGPFLGNVVDSIAWGCNFNYDNFAAGQVRYSCGLATGTGNINVDPRFVAPATGDLRLQASSPCIDSGDTLSPLDADGSRSDMGAYPTLGANAPQVYCTGKANSAGCTPFLAPFGFASASSPESFLVRAFNVVNQKNGLFFYGLSGRQSAPFQGGTKCVANPVHRLGLQPSGGNLGVNDCSGIYVQDFNALIQGNVDPLLVAGAQVNVQCWYRDPSVPSNTGLSNGLEFHITP